MKTDATNATPKQIDDAVSVVPQELRWRIKYKLPFKRRVKRIFGLPFRIKNEKWLPAY
jgi:hypothetical protein